MRLTIRAGCNVVTKPDISASTLGHVPLNTLHGRVFLPCALTIASSTISMYLDCPKLMTSETARPDKRQVETRLAKKRGWILRGTGLQVK
jgi:hypothetical protein